MTTNDGFQNGRPFGMEALRNGGPEPLGYAFQLRVPAILSLCSNNIGHTAYIQLATTVYTKKNMRQY